MNRKKSIGFIVVILLLLLIIIAGAAVFGIQFMKSRNVVEGNYVNQIDISDEIVTNGVLWLATAQESEDPVEEFKGRLGEAELTAQLNIQKTNSKSGNFSMSLNKDEYDEIAVKAKDALADALSDIIAERMKSMGIAEADDAAFVEEQIESALGMSAEEYIKVCEVTMMPAYEKLEEKYADEGSFEVVGDTIVWSSQSGTWTDHYVLKDDMIILTDGDGKMDYPVIFRLVK